MTRVEIWNYKTIEHIAFEFEGYTLVLGKNFIGKSAIIAAIVSALTNRSGDGFIRYGEKFCQVLIQRDGHSVLWHKEKGDSYYIIDEVTYKKIGKADVPQPIQDMGFGPLDVSGEKVLLWFAKQFEPLFLVNRSRQNFTTDLIASVSNLDPLYKGVDAAKKDSKNNKADLNIRKGDLADAREEAKKYDALDTFSSLKETVDEKLTELVLLDKEIETISNLIYKMDTNREELVRTFPVTKMVSIDMQKYEGAVKEVDMATRLLAKYNQAAEAYKALAPIQQIKPIPVNIYGVLQGLINAVANVEKLQGAYAEAVRDYNRYKNSENLVSLTSKITDLEKLDKEVSQVAQLLHNYNSAMARIAELTALSKLTKLPDLTELDTQVTILTKLVAGYKMAAVEYTTAENELKLACEEADVLKIEKASFSKCPTCERPFNEH